MGAIINAVVLSSLVIVGLHTTLASTVPTNHTSDFEKAGFTFIGTMRDSQSGAVKGGIQSIGVQSISLFISPREHLATQDQAVRNCRNLYGHLLFVLNDEQFQDVRDATNRITDYFWTSAMYDVYAGIFVWSHLGLPVSNNYFGPTAWCRTGGTYRGLAVQGSLSSFGFCSMDSDVQLRYICRV